jgi:putative flippase GtrA
MMVRRYIRALYTGPLAAQVRRFAVVGLVAAAVQLVLLWVFVDFGGLNYLLGAAVAIEITIILSYVLNNAWTFEAVQKTGRTAHVVGLVKTNLVRGSAIPIQLAVLFALVQWQGLPYLLANAGGIVVSGVYRYVLDANWTWG